MKISFPQAFEPKVLYTRPFREQFARCIGHRPIRIDIVVPYVGKTPWGSVVQFFGRLISRGCAIHMVTIPPSQSDRQVMSPADAKRIEDMGVSLKIYTGSPLHSKIYQFSYPKGGRMAFVGSANFSLGGLKNNQETVAFFRAKADNDKVAGEIRRISGPGVPYYIYQQWEARNG